ncbi:phage late control D family protein [Pseudomonas putida]|uniref:phage late control D family protein n=1 Tax=Pseudomonas putida TaxID=303 RepID=UPI001EF8A5BC|nr:phage late control D family protein [Pseudomonas putida]ULL06020.1 phage late control D family protein [Pseudomonas putida]
MTGLDQLAAFITDTREGLQRDGAYGVPAFRLSVDGKDIARLISPRLMSLELTDNRGLEADQLSITLSDHDGLLEIPPKGAVVKLWLGWSDTGLIDKGTYTVDETEHSGAPDSLSIRARSADLRGSLKTKRERSWSAVTLGKILTEIATAHDLIAKIDPEVAARAVKHLDQANESDANILTRLGELHDAVITVKAGCLICLAAGSGKTASGMTLPHITLSRSSGDGHRFLQADRDSYDSVKAYYYDIGSTKKQEAIAGGGEKVKELRHTYSDRDSALRAARSELNRLQRGSATLSFTLAKGRADLVPELTYSLRGVKSEIDAIVWHGGNVRHSLSPTNGYTTSLELESKLPEDSVEGLYQDQKGGAYTGVVAFYRDKTTGKETSVIAGDATRPKRIKRVYDNKEAAQKAADQEWKKMQGSSR